MTTTNNNKQAVPGIRDGWFSETEAMWPGQKFSLALEEFSEQKSVLFHQDSGHQKILVFRSAQYGNVLVLDGVIQLTERDEFAFHEMMVHLPLCSHPNPKSVCIVGGGDGGVLRQVRKHKCVKSITLVEIDPMVTQVAKQYFRQDIRDAFEDPRLTIVQDDAANFIAAREAEFDVIITDNGDPIGPAQSLFEPAFYEKMYNALAPEGIVCVQAESFWIHLDLISDLHACSNEIFSHAEYASTMVPTYPCGQIGFILAGKGTKSGTCRRPTRIPDFVQDLQWYNPQTHMAAFVLPTFVAKRLGQCNHDDDDDADARERIDRCFLDNCTIS
ncbi:Polyamine aminopropyltransferase [Seminavis robusta]|uniref:Polyamine aminopropyltransferase n=1 Tax=Seminavis robusta TaxID=568900 RepID=A0A9N8H8N1_9STRA|nr:Polyamine aminopropyltransferase [Seminavis robusta]|eukprot:Sro246_g097760.1 Polyamine aminopropyltransferase (329) ;mRNA; r:51730-52956